MVAGVLVDNFQQREPVNDEGKEWVREQADAQPQQLNSNNGSASFSAAASVDGETDSQRNGNTHTHNNAGVLFKPNQVVKAHTQRILWNRRHLSHSENSGDGGGNVAQSRKP